MPHLEALSIFWLIDENAIGMKYELETLTNAVQSIYGCTYLLYYIRVKYHTYKKWHDYF